MVSMTFDTNLTSCNILLLNTFNSKQLGPVIRIKMLLQLDSIIFIPWLLHFKKFGQISYIFL